MNNQVAENEAFSLVPSVGCSILSFDDFTIVRTVTNASLRSMEESFRNRQTESSKVDVDHVSLERMTAGESVSLMYWIDTVEYVKDWETYVSDVQQHVHTDTHRLHCRIRGHVATPDEILECANEWPANSVDRKLIYAAGTATCMGSIAQLVSFGLMEDEILLCEQHKTHHGAVNGNLINPLTTKIREHRKSNDSRNPSENSRFVLFDASKVLSCCRITQHGAVQYGTCSMHIFRDVEDPNRMVLLADILRVPTAPAGHHTLLSPISASALSETMCKWQGD